tara:strand:- start:240 stop:407 length:168 start_codon:yes stop_codon:yes gene_type:complete
MAKGIKPISMATYNKHLRAQHASKADLPLRLAAKMLPLVCIFLGVEFTWPRPAAE